MIYSKAGLIREYALKNALTVFGAFVFGVLNSLATVLLLLSIGKFYELSLHSGSAKGQIFDSLGISIPDTSSFFIFFITLIILKSLFQYLQLLLTDVINERFSRDLSQKLFSHQIQQAVSTFQKRPVGAYLLRYSGDLGSIQKLLSKGVINLFSDLVFLAVSLTMLFTVNSRLSFYLIIAILLAGLVLFLLGKPLGHFSQLRRTQKARNIHFVNSRLHSFYTLKAFNRERPEIRTFERRSNDLSRKGIAFSSINSLSKAGLSFFYFAMLAMLLWVINIDPFFHTPNFPQSTIVVFILLVVYMQGAIKRVLNVNTIWLQGIMSFDKLLGILNLPREERIDTRTKFSTRRFGAEIVFESVDFSYGTGRKPRPVLTNFSATFAPYTLTEIKGSQGSGKSSILKLIAALYDPNAGKITINGFPYNEQAPFAIRKCVALVSDDAKLLGDTVLQSIVYSTRRSRRQAIIKLMKETGFDFGKPAEEFLDEPLTEHGANLSAGQRRMLLYIRALLTRKVVILFDEPFKDLDRASIRLAVKLLNSLKSEKTIIITTSRTPSALEVDSVVEITQ